MPLRGCAGRRSDRRPRRRLQARRPACGRGVCIECSHIAQDVAAGDDRAAVQSACQRASDPTSPHALPSIAGERTEFTMSQKSFLTISTLSICVSFALAASVRAQDAAMQPTVEVTASRVGESVAASLADVSVITRAEIDASAAPDLIEILRLQAGIDVVRGGG